MKSKKDIEFFCTCKLDFLNQDLRTACIDGRLGKNAATKMLLDFSWLVHLGFCSNDDYINFSREVHCLVKSSGGDE